MYNQRRTYFENEDFDLSLEEKDGHLFVHLVFFNVTKKAVNRVKAVWEEVRAKCYWLGYEQINTYTKDLRVVKLFDNYELLGEFDLDGEKYEVARWVLT